MGAVAKRLFDSAFQDELLTQVEANPDTRSWSAAGRGRTKALPNGEDGAWWRLHGPDMVQSWIDWRHDSAWQVWTTPDNQPAIELEIIADCEVDPEATKCECGDCVIPVKMIIDRVMVNHPAKELCILDLKSGARTPDSDLQLAFYRYGIYQKYGVDIKLGTYWMARKGTIVEPFELGRYSIDLMEGMFRRFRQAVDDGIFLPHPSTKCRACAVNKYCAVFGGARSERDPDHPLFGKEHVSTGEVEASERKLQGDVLGEVRTVPDGDAGTAG